MCLCAGQKEIAIDLTDDLPPQKQAASLLHRTEASGRHATDASTRFESRVGSRDDSIEILDDQADTEDLASNADARQNGE